MEPPHVSQIEEVLYTERLQEDLRYMVSDRTFRVLHPTLIRNVNPKLLQGEEYFFTVTIAKSPSVPFDQPDSEHKFLDFKSGLYQGCIERHDGPIWIFLGTPNQHTNHLYYFAIRFAPFYEN